MATFPNIPNIFNYAGQAAATADAALAKQIPVDGIVDAATNLFSPTFSEDVLNRMSIMFGDGPFYHQLRTFFKSTNKFDHNTLPGNSLLSGYTFITRPRLCLHDSSVSRRVEFIPMMTDKYNALPFGIRCLLDTKFCSEDSRSKACALIDRKNALFTPLNNGLIGMSGWPDMNLETSTTQTGFHSEDQTIVNGYDQLNKTYEFTLDFRDPQCGPILSIFFYWILYMGMVSKGIMPAYMEDINQRRINYSVSIYRFVVDPSRRYIVHYAKATGCYPKSIPIGSLFNFSEGDRFVRSAGNFSIPFVANKVEYNNPDILGDFNTLMRRYDPQIEQRAAIPLSVESNYNGLPYVHSGSGVGPDGIKPLELIFR